MLAQSVEDPQRVGGRLLPSALGCSAGARRHQATPQPPRYASISRQALQTSVFDREDRKAAIPCSPGIARSGVLLRPYLSSRRSTERPSSPSRRAERSASGMAQLLQRGASTHSAARWEDT
jgi:hypothetical protein